MAKIPFVLHLALNSRNNGYTVKTKDGRTVHNFRKRGNIPEDAKMMFPYTGEIEGEPAHAFNIWDEKGSYLANGIECEKDLILIEPKY